MSLVPPVHVVLLDSANIYNTFYEASQLEAWKDGLPTNALLISGPSKTADIQVTMAYGAHGPKELIILLMGDEQ
jgi:L-lactate dehydrogenase complex protein LldG